MVAVMPYLVSKCSLPILVWVNFSNILILKIELWGCDT